MVANGLELAFSFEVIETVEVGVHRKGGIVIAYAVKPFFHDPIYLLGSWVVIIIEALHVPKLGVVGGGGTCKVLEEGEVGAQRNGVSCAIITISKE